MSPKLVREYFPPSYQHVAGNHAWGSAQVMQEFYTLAEMSLVRATNGTYRTGAASLATAGNNVLRMEDRGLVNWPGKLALLEGSRTNLFHHRRPNDFSNKAGVVINALAGTSLLDGRTQDTVDFGQSAPNHQIYDSTGANTAADTYAHSVWYKVLTGTNTNQEWNSNISAPTGVISVTTSPSGWTYAVSVDAYASGRAIGQLVRDNAIETKTWIWDAHQFELGGFASSYVDVSTAPAGRDADELTATVGNFPERIINGKYSLIIAPEWAQNQVSSDVVVLSVGGVNDELRYNATTKAFEVIISGVQRAIGSAGTNSAEQPIRIDMDWFARTIGVSGLTTGNGVTAISGTDEWPTDQPIRLGGRHGTNGVECFANYSGFIG